MKKPLLSWLAHDYNDLRRAKIDYLISPEGTRMVEDAIHPDFISLKTTWIENLRNLYKAGHGTKAAQDATVELQKAAQDAKEAKAKLLNLPEPAAPPAEAKPAEASKAEAMPAPPIVTYELFMRAIGETV